MSQNQFYKIKNNDGSLNVTQYCMCTDNTNQATLHCPLGLMQNPGKNSIYRKKREM
jgi:hypothetical protein